MRNKDKQLQAIIPAVSFKPYTISFTSEYATVKSFKQNIFLPALCFSLMRLNSLPMINDIGKDDF